jgi:hypothetical protein
MPDTDTILKDVKTRADGDATLFPALGAIYMGMAPPVAALPFWMFKKYRPSALDDAFGARYLEIHSIQFDIYATSMATLATYQDALHARFDRAAITMTAGTCIDCSREFSIVNDTGTYKNGLPVFQSVSRYRVKIDRTR